MFLNYSMCIGGTQSLHPGSSFTSFPPPPQARSQPASLGGQRKNLGVPTKVSIALIMR